MKCLFVSFFIFFSFFSTLFSKSFALESDINIDHALPEYSKVYDDTRDPFKDAVAALNLAKATKRNVIIKIGGNWCTWCERMDAFLVKQPAIYQALHNRFVVLKVNVSDSNENTKFMKSLPPILGYPHMFVSSNVGKMLLSKDTAELLDNGDYSVNRWVEFLDKWQINPLAGTTIKKEK